MLHRYTIALVLVAVAAGACSQSQQETIAPETAVSSTVVLTVPLAETTSLSTVPSSATIPEIEFSPVTALPARPAVTAVPEVLLRNGVAMVAWDLTVETAEVVDVAVEACQDALVVPVVSGCTSAIWEACYSHELSYGEMLRSAGTTNFAEPELDQLGLGLTLCSEAFTAEVAEFAAVLAARYGDRYFNGDIRMLLEDVEEGYYLPSGGWPGPAAFEGDRKRDFIDFRIYLGRKGWGWSQNIDFGRGRFITNEAQVRVDLLIEVVNDLRLAYSALLAEPTEEFAEWYVERFKHTETIPYYAQSVAAAFNWWENKINAEDINASYAEEILDAVESSAEYDRQIIDVPKTSDDITVLCEDAIYAARTGKLNWESEINNCMIAAENCRNAPTDQDRQCNNMLAVIAKLQLMWQKLPEICASAEDIEKNIIIDSYNDTCRQAALDTYVYATNSLIRGELPWKYNRLVEEIEHAAYFLALPLVGELPRELRAPRPLLGRGDTFLAVTP